MRPSSALGWNKYATSGERLAALFVVLTFVFMMAAWLSDRAGSPLHSALVTVADLVIRDILVVRPGEGIALDSVIAEGPSAIDQASLTGESIPVAKAVGDPVFAGTINQTGGLAIRVTRLAKDSTIEKLVRLVEEAQSEKAATQRFLDRAEQFYAIGVILFTLGLILVPTLFYHEAFQTAFYRAMTVMVVASPCALIISTPASILSAIGGAARRGQGGGAVLLKVRYRGFAWCSMAGTRHLGAGRHRL